MTNDDDNNDDEDDDMMIPMSRDYPERILVFCGRGGIIFLFYNFTDLCIFII